MYGVRAGYVFEYLPVSNTRSLLSLISLYSTLFMRRRERESCKVEAQICGYTFINREPPSAH
jgi:hypothetical protein